MTRTRRPGPGWTVARYSTTLARGRLLSGPAGVVLLVERDGAGSVRGWWPADVVSGLRGLRWALSAELTRRTGRYVPVRLVLLATERTPAAPVGCDVQHPRRVRRWLQSLPGDVDPGQAQALGWHIRAVAAAG